MDTDEARQVVFWHYGTEYPERAQADFTPRGFWLRASGALRAHAARHRSDSTQNEPTARTYDRLADAAAVLATAHEK